jgi:hypothetical protein
MNIKNIKKAMVTMLLITTLILLMNITTYGQTNSETLETPGIHGEVSCKYELLSYNPGQEWTVNLYYKFDGWLSWVSMGALQTTYTSGIARNIAFTPTNQLYDIYIKANIGDKISLQLGQWCNHPVNSYTAMKDIQANIKKLSNIPFGIYLYGAYKF